jgi:hypothetical protein
LLRSTSRGLGPGWWSDFQLIARVSTPRAADDDYYYARTLAGPGTEVLADAPAAGMVHGSSTTRLDGMRQKADMWNL